MSDFVGRGIRTRRAFLPRGNKRTTRNNCVVCALPSIDYLERPRLRDARSLHGAVCCEDQMLGGCTVQAPFAAVAQGCPIRMGQALRRGNRRRLLGPAVVIGADGREALVPRLSIRQRGRPGLVHQVGHECGAGTDREQRIGFVDTQCSLHSFHILIGPKGANHI